jgi:hypothetical protein
MSLASFFEWLQKDRETPPAPWPYWVFQPQPDITTYELALIIKRFQERRCWIGLPFPLHPERTPELVLGDGLGRHFVRTEKPVE